MVEKIEDKEIFKGRRISLHVTKYKEHGIETEREEVRVRDAVIVLAITNENKILFVKEYRELIEKEELELPAGIIEEGETPEEAAIRELEEETGYRAHNVEFLRKIYSSCGITNEALYVYYARNLEKTKQNLDFDEFIEVEEKTIEEAKELLDKNIIDSASANVGLMTYFLYLKDRINDFS